MMAVSHGNGGALRIEVFAELGSTNIEARRRAASGDRGPLWIRALRQTAGLGRSGRRWDSTAGNLAATFLFEPHCPPVRLPELSLVAGVAVVDGIGELLSVGSDAGIVKLKWPNDVLVDGAKCAGILIESNSDGRTLTAMVGIGINVAEAPRIDGRQTTCLSEHVTTRNADDMMEALARSLAKWLAIWDQSQGFAEIRAAWLERAGPLGGAISVHTGDRLAQGRFAGIDVDGALLMDVGGGCCERFTHGDVTREATERS